MKHHTLFFILFALSLLSYGQKNIEPTYSPKGSISVRSNFLPWLLLFSNAGMEYKVSDEFGLVLDGTWAHWKLNNKYWRIWNLAPQARYYIGESKCTYFGAQYIVGEYNLTNKQGVYMGGGITLGRQVYGGKNIMVDFGVALGYLNLYKKEKYDRIGNEDYLMSQRTSNGYWGPTGVSMTFVWKIN